MNAFKPWVACTAVALLTACASPSPAPILLTIPPLVAATAPAAAATPFSSGSAPAPLLAVRRVGIPEYLVARRVRYRSDASTLAEWPNTYWAERIEIGVSREFTSALRQQLPGWSLCDTSCSDQVPALSLQVDLVPMDYVRSTGKLQARARVTVSSAALPPKVLQSQDVTYDIASGGDNAQAQAQAIAQLLQQVSVVSATLVRQVKP